MPTDEAAITLQGLTFDDVWNIIVAAIGLTKEHNSNKTSHQNSKPRLTKKFSFFVWLLYPMEAPRGPKGVL